MNDKKMNKNKKSKKSKSLKQSDCEEYEEVIYYKGHKKNYKDKTGYKN